MHSRCNLYYINLMAQQGFFEKGHFFEKLTLFVSFLSAKRNFFFLHPQYLKIFQICTAKYILQIHIFSQSFKIWNKLINFVNLVLGATFIFSIQIWTIIFIIFFDRKTRIFLSFLPGDWRNYAAVKKKENEGSHEVMATVPVRKLIFTICVFREDGCVNVRLHNTGSEILVLSQETLSSSTRTSSPFSSSS